MVDGLDRLRAKLTRTIPQRVRHHLKQSMAQYAGKVVSTMEAFVPEEEGYLKNSIAWTWGDAPAGSLVLGSVGGNQSDLRITIYAGDETTIVKTKSGGAFQNARLQEFGTKNMPASPYFYVSWRLNKRRTKAAMRRAVKKGLSEGSR